MRAGEHIPATDVDAARKHQAYKPGVEEIRAWLGENSADL